MVVVVVVVVVVMRMMMIMGGDGDDDDDDDDACEMSSHPARGKRSLCVQIAFSSCDGICSLKDYVDTSCVTD
eukprot:1310207-Pleurochrysis_carterae.AAC.1